MKRKDYENNKWYKITDDNFWVEDLEDEFPGCFTVVCDFNAYDEPFICTRDSSYAGWGTLAKYGKAMFMIVELPNNENVKDC